MAQSPCLPSVPRAPPCHPTPGPVSLSLTRAPTQLPGHVRPRAPSGRTSSMGQNSAAAQAQGTALQTRTAPAHHAGARPWLLTWAPGFPCCPGGPGSPWGPCRTQSTEGGSRGQAGLLHVPPGAWAPHPGLSHPLSLPSKRQQGCPDGNGRWPSGSQGTRPGAALATGSPVQGMLPRFRKRSPDSGQEGPREEDRL